MQKIQLRKLWLILLRFLLFIFSAVSLGCHIAQIVVWHTRDSGTNWWPHFVPYILYFVGPGISLISAFALVLVSFVSIRSIRGDRILSVVNIALLIAVIVYNTLKSGDVPYSGEFYDTRGERGFVTYYGQYTWTPNQRCWLINGTWLGCIITAFIWVVLALYTYLQKASDIDADERTQATKEEVPMVYSSEDGTVVPTEIPEAHESDQPYSQYNQYPEYPHSSDSPYQDQSRAVKPDAAAPYPSYTGYYQHDGIMKTEHNYVPRNSTPGSQPPHSHSGTH